MSEWQAKFAAHYKRYVQSLVQPRGPDGMCPLDHEFAELQAVDDEVSFNPNEFRTGSQPINKGKNRNESVLPNELTKVELHASHGRGEDTYINANYIDGSVLFDSLPFNYIAAQAPLECTVRMFWRMVAECSVSFIVMLTTDVNSAHYWPTGDRVIRPTQSYTVRHRKRVQEGDLIIRHMVLTNIETHESRDITQFQYIGWPDDGVPRNTLSLMEIILSLGQRPESMLNPVLVHCGAGVGRTGVFVAMHVCLALFQMEKAFTVKQVVRLLKYQRTGMVKTKLQYQFLVMGLCREFERMVIKHQRSVQTLVHNPFNSSSLQQPPHPALLGDTSATQVSPVRAVPMGSFHDGVAHGSAGGSPPRSPPQHPTSRDVYRGVNPVPPESVPALSVPAQFPRATSPSGAGSVVRDYAAVPPPPAVYGAYPEQLPLPPAAGDTRHVTHASVTTYSQGLPARDAPQTYSPPPPDVTAPAVRPGTHAFPPAAGGGGGGDVGRYRDAIYGGPQLRTASHPRALEGEGALGPRSSPRPPVHADPAPFGRGAGAVGQDPAGGQRESVMSVCPPCHYTYTHAHTYTHTSTPQMLQKLTEQTRRMRSSPATSAAHPTYAASDTGPSGSHVAASDHRR